MSTLPAPSSGGVYPSGQPGSHRYSHHQGKFFAHWLTLRSRDESAVARALSAARVDMNPHQVDAALFALKSPVEAGVLLADEVGLGKTIEAGLVLAQHWAQRRRRLLLIVPATLRKQWTQERREVSTTVRHSREQIVQCFSSARRKQSFSDRRRDHRDVL